ncbi:MAG: tetratricopeptide repeat protein, partial [Bradyrhizobiaceae bacterium]|nr:tetratricopeptide repeat protein [Bradyrhizobiaceae bacterium]
VRGDVYYIKGTVGGDKSDYDLAIAEYSKAVRLTPNDAAPHLERAQAYQAKGDGDHMIADYDEAIRLDPDNPSVYWKRGIA